MSEASQSGSIDHPTHWWYRARERIMREVFEGAVPPGSRALEIGSADGPSTAWLRERTSRVATDIDPRGLRPGDVCASADALPFADGAFDVVGAFDVIEHVADEVGAISEIARVLRPGGVLLVSVPAYQWAWTSFDDRAGHHRRYTRRRLRTALAASGLDVTRTTYAFTGTFALFALDRLRSRLFGSRPAGVSDGDPHPLIVRLLLRLGLIDARLLRRLDLPFGSSVLAVARQPES